MVQSILLSHFRLTVLILRSYFFCILLWFRHMLRYLLFNEEDTNFLEKMSSFFFFIILLIPLISSAGDTDPVAAVSIYSDISYQSGRTCSTSCLWHRGPFRQYNPGHDLAIELSCGVAAVNGCYCKADFASSASSYISSCVSKGCSNVESVNEEIKTIMALYDGYCKTANVEVVTTTTSAELVVATADSSATMTWTSATGVLQNLLISSSPHPTTFSSWSTSASPSKTSATEDLQNMIVSLSPSKTSATEDLQNMIVSLSGSSSCWSLRFIYIYSSEPFCDIREYGWIGEIGSHRIRCRPRSRDPKLAACAGNAVRPVEKTKAENKQGQLCQHGDESFGDGPRYYKASSDLVVIISSAGVLLAIYSILVISDIAVFNFFSTLDASRAFKSSIKQKQIRQGDSSRHIAMSISLESSSFVINKSSSISLAIYIKSHPTSVLPGDVFAPPPISSPPKPPLPGQDITPRNATSLSSCCLRFRRLVGFSSRREDSLSCRIVRLFLSQSGGGGDSTCVDPNRNRNRNRNSLSHLIHSL